MIRLQRLHIPRAIAAASLMVALVGGTTLAAHALSDDAAWFFESLPNTAQKTRQAARATRGQPATTIDKMQMAATQLEQAGKVCVKPAPPRRAAWRGCRSSGPS